MKKVFISDETNIGINNIDFLPNLLEEIDKQVDEGLFVVHIQISHYHQDTISKKYNRPTIVVFNSVGMPKMPFV